MRPVRIPIPGYLGVNLLDNLTLLRPEECRRLENLCFTPGSGLGKRKGIGFFRKVFPGEVVNFTSIFMPTFECNPFIFGVYKQVANDVVAAIGDAAVSSVNITNAYEGRPLFVGFDQMAFCFIGHPFDHAAVKFVKDDLAANGITVSNFDFDAADNGFAPKVAAAYRDRMAYFNLGRGYENTGVFSDDLEPETVGASAKDTRQFLFGGRDGDRIIAALEINLSDSGTPATSALLILREHSTYLMKGEPAQTTDTGSYFGDVEISKVNVNCGCASAQTVVTTPYGVIWAGIDDVWLLRTGQVPVAIGAKIRTQLLQSPPSQRYLWSAIYKDGIYRLSILSPGQGPSANSDPCGEQWWLDLRDGAPQNFRQARWFGPHIYGVLALTGGSVTTGTHMQVTDTRPGREQDIYSIEGENLCVYDVAEGYDRSQETAVPLIAGPGTMVRAANVVTVSLAIAHDFVVGDSVVLDAALTTIESQFLPGAYTVATVPTTQSFTYASVAANYTNLCTHSFRPANTLGIAEQYDNEIVTDLHSKAYDIDNPMVDKTLAGVEVNVQSTLPLCLHADVLVDRGRQVVAMVERSPAPGFETGVDDADTDLLTDEFVSIGMFPAGGSRYNGKSHQLKLSDPASYVLTDAMTSFSFYRGGTLYTATLTAGCYLTIDDLLDELIRGMNVADVLDWQHNQVGSPATLQVFVSGPFAPGVGRAMTGVTSGATGTITSFSFAAGFGWVIINNIVGTFVVGERFIASPLFLGDFIITSLVPIAATTAPPRPPLVAIGTTASGTYLLFQNDGSAVAVQTLTAAQVLSTRLIGAMLGFNTSIDATNEGQTSIGYQISAKEPAPWTRSGTLEYGGIVLKLTPQRRGPV